MADSSLHYEIKQVPPPAGGLRFDLIVEGSTVATARVAPDVVQDMQATLGVDLHTIEDDLKSALLSVLTHERDKVTVTEPVEDPEHPLRFRSRYTYRSFEDVSTGVVWYDVAAGATGPESVPAMVRNRMRQEVHRKLTTSGTQARALVDL